MRVSSSLAAMLLVTTLAASCQYLSGVNELVVVRDASHGDAGRGDAVAPQGLVGYWRFDENSGTTAANSAGDHNHCTIGGATWAPGIIGSALRFDGVDDYVSAGDATSLYGSTALTIEAWVNPDLIGGKYRVIAHISMTYYFQLYIGDGNLEAFFYQTTNQDYLRMSSTIPLNTWTHVAVTYDGSQVTLYKNGLPEAFAVTGSLPSRGNSLFIGSDGRDPDRPFSGLIDEVRVYNRALTTAEVLADYNVR
jgi:hypothetical protein